MKRVLIITWDQINCHIVIKILLSRIKCLTLTIETIGKVCVADTALSYEQIMALFKEIAEEQKREAEERKKTELFINKVSRDIDKLSKNVGGLNRSMGELIETLIASRLWEKFADYPYNLKRAYQRVPIFNEESRSITDIDILLADSEWVMAVEVKRKPDKEDIDHHIKRMDLIRKYPPAETVGKKLLGAIAGGAVDPDIQNYAHQAGFFILELRGEAVALVKPHGEYSPRIW